MEQIKKYELVVGLEVHMQLSTKTKAFCADNAAYGGSPNEFVGPLSLGLPGTLPVLNENVIKFATKLGLATNCKIRAYNEFARKNYFYADLPKGYQITQFTTPICYDGFVDLEVNNDAKRIGITRIHIEEDAGKSNHDLDPYYTLVDLNRAGVPLLEIVSEPDFRSSDETTAYLHELRKLVRYLEVCDGNMEEGSMRCDVNISVRLYGAEKFGERSEIKNLNSIRNVKRAIDHEYERQIAMVEKGVMPHQETRRFDAAKGITYPMRSKEDAHDYRYFPEPDLPPFVIDEKFIASMRAAMPPLSRELAKKYAQEFGLSEYDAKQLTEDKATALYYEALTSETQNFKAAANWVLGPIKSYLNEFAKEINDFQLSPKIMAALISLIDEGKTNFSTASQKIFPELLKSPEKPPMAIAIEMNLIQDQDVDALSIYCDEVLNKYPDKVAEYKAGKKGVLGLFMGEVMKLSGGKADPKNASQILTKKLS